MATSTTLTISTSTTSTSTSFEMKKKVYMPDTIGFVECIEKFGDDLTVVNAARVSFDKISYELSEGDKKLINYLAKHDHVCRADSKSPRGIFCEHRISPLRLCRSTTMGW
jgi:hypothetical protein